MTLAAANPMTDASEALARLESVLRRYDRLLVAFSGGVDSAVLLAAAHRVLGANAVGLTADSPSMARDELERAVRFATALGVEHRVARTEEMAKPEYVRNGRDRCFWCKQTLFEVSAEIAAAAGGATVAYGYTRDDVGDFRPGHEAAKSFGVAAPLWEADLGKPEIRAIARELGLDVWDKPAAPCLASRIPYGSEVTTGKLRAIEAMEGVLHDLGFRVCRARFDGTSMRIEVEAAEIPRAGSTDVQQRLQATARALGVQDLTLDPEGFVSGKLNRRSAP